MSGMRYWRDQDGELWHTRTAAGAALAKFDSHWEEVMVVPIADATIVERATQALSDNWDPDRDPFLMAMFRDYVATLADAGFLTGPVTAIDPKMLRETLCVAQAALSRSSYDADRRKEHLDRLGELIRRIDVIRPLDTAGQHGELHTPDCGCDLSGELPPAVHIVDNHDD